MSAEEVKPAKEGKNLLWGHIPSIIALLSVSASLFGYGVVTGLAASVNLDQGSLLAGAFDLITLVWPGMLAIISGVNDLPWLKILREAMSGATGTSLAVGIVVFLVVIAVRFKPLLIGARAAVASSFDQFRLRRSAPSSALLIAIGAALIAFVGAMTISLLSTLTLFCVLMGLTIPPSFGYVSGQAFVQKAVIEPPVCAATQNRQQRMDRKTEIQKAREAGKKTKPETTGAPCVLVTSIDPTKPFQRFGRSVVSSGSSILIWDPESGRGDRIPTATMMVSSIDEKGLQALLNGRAQSAGQHPAVPPFQVPSLGNPAVAVK